MPRSFDPRFDPFDPNIAAEDIPDVDLSQIDWNDPASIFGSLGGGPGTNLPIPKMISPDQVRKQARERCMRIFGDWELLNGILARHETTLHKRWLKKTKKQRAEILLAAWPNMASVHRPDFLAFRKESEREREAGTKFREAYMWPYINLEDLSKPKTLLILLQARTRNTPDAFAMADYNAARLGLVTKAIVPPFLNSYTMMLTDCQTPERYGKLYSWEENPEVFQWMMSGKGMHPGQGLLVLEMQQMVLGFLVECCKRIMHDISAQDIASHLHPLQSPVVMTGETVNGFASLAVMAAETPYRLPASMDLLRLESLIAAKKSAAEDHVWALREDPGYFVNALLEAKEHRQEMIQDTNGRRHPILVLGREEVFAQRIIGNVVASAHLKLEVWSEIHKQVKKLIILQMKHRKDISKDKDLPEEYLNALLTFQHYLNQAAKGPKGELKQCAVASPPLRRFFARVPPRDSNSSMIQITQKPDVKLGKVEAELIWLLRILWEDDHQLFLVGLTNVVDELERLIQSEAKAKEMLSTYMADLISDLSVLGEAIRQLKTYQPWAQTFENSLVDKEGDIKKEFAHRTSGWGVVMAALDGPDQMKIVRLGEPGERKFYYPVDKRRTKENVEAMRSAEKNLDVFWSSVDQNMRTCTRKEFEDTALWRLLSQSKVLQRTPEYIEPDKQARSKEGSYLTEITKPLSELYFDLEHRTEGTIDRTPPMAKLPIAKRKTKGVITTPTPSTEAVASGDQPDTRTNFQVDARALKVFRTIFYTPSLTATPGEVPWTDFLHAMVSAGFEPEKLYGSVWQFKPTELDVDRSIQFHEPHPSGKLPYVTARRFGRRLNRAYGWEGSMFLEAPA